MTFCPEWIEGSPNLLPPGEYCLKFGFCSLEDGVMELWSFGGVMELWSYKVMEFWRSYGVMEL